MRRHNFYAGRIEGVLYVLMQGGICHSHNAWRISVRIDLIADIEVIETGLQHEWRGSAQEVVCF